ncbi:hypothetical protein V8F33_003771 [Rhypophila sp. PSN 637]
MLQRRRCSIGFLALFARAGGTIPDERKVEQDQVAATGNRRQVPMVTGLRNAAGCSHKPSNAAVGRSLLRPTADNQPNQPRGRRPIMGNARPQPEPTTPTRPRGPGRTPVWPGVSRARPAVDSESSEDEMNYKKLKGAKFPGMRIFDEEQPPAS